MHSKFKSISLHEQFYVIIYLKRKIGNIEHNWNWSMQMPMPCFYCVFFSFGTIMRSANMETKKT